MRFIPFRSFHSSIFRFARGNRLPPSSSSGSDPPRVEDDFSVQEQFARLELQRLEEQQFPAEPSHLSPVDEDAEPENLPRTPIDPSTTSVILFPGQGTQFVGMG